MKISELIEKLESAKNQFGDIEIERRDSEWGHLPIKGNVEIRDEDKEDLKLLVLS